MNPILPNWLRQLFPPELAPDEGALVPLDVLGLPTGYPFDRYRLQAVLLPALEAKGFVLSPDRLIRLRHLLALLPANALAADLGDYLCPIFATNEQQQDRFHEVFAGIAAVFTQVETESPEREEPDPIVEPPPPPPPGDSGNPPPRPPEPTAPPAGKAQGPGEGGKPPLIPELDQCTEPPFVWSIAPDKKIPLEPDAGFNRTLTRLRSRERTDLRSVDWPATVQASARMAGMPAIRYRHHTRPVEYLMLVERFAAEDHRALLFDRLWNILHEQEVLVERFFHDGDLRSCHNEQFPQGISLRDLRHRYASSRLLVLGSGYRMLSARTGKPADWTAALPDWPVRALLTPVTRQLWGLRERLLSDLFTLLPAAWESLRYLSETADPDPHARFADLPADVRAVADWPPLTLESPFARNLRRHYEPELCRWIAACAVWPSLHFDLTLRLGRLLSAPGNNLLTYDRLTRLTRLDWFANGRIPRDARIELLEFLDARHPEILRQVNVYLLQLLEENKPENPKSVAFAEHQINIAILRVIVAETPDPEHVRQLRTVLKRLDRDAELTDVVLTASIEVMLEKLGVEVPPAQPPSPQPETQPEPIEAGAVFAGCYLLEGRIGRGGIADVWKAYDRETSRMVSLKIYRRTDAVGEKLARYEYDMTNGLQHPNINPVLDFGVAAQAPFLVFPFREKSGSHLIGQATEADLWKIIHDIGSALAYLHGLNPPVVHGDLKPEHFLLTEEGTWVLSDFGIAEEMGEGTERSLRNDPELLKWLKQRTLLPYQVPPERQHPNLKVNSPTVDIWMLGAALYQIVAGKPWTQVQLNRGELISMEEGVSTYPIDLINVISECLIWEREYRPKAAELLYDANLSREKEILEACKRNKTVVNGVAKSTKGGGLVLSIDGITKWQAFMPNHQIDVKPISNLKAYLNKEMEVLITRIEEKDKRVIVSQLEVTKLQSSKRREETLKSIEKGKVVEGVVKSFADFGAFVDLGGVDGLLYITDISWGRIGHPSEVLKLRQRINVVVLDFKENKKRISLGLKQLTPHPWKVLSDDLDVGIVVKGRVVNIEDYGVFVEITPGVEGLIHISEITWGKQNINAKEYFKLGQEVEARVVTIDRADHKMSLSIKQLTADPWTDIETRFPVGSRHSGTVKNMTNYGIFVELSEGVGGMVHISDLSWTKRYAHPSQFTKVRAPIDVIVLDIDKEKRQIFLGHKQIEPNPWDAFDAIFPVGSYHEATVLKRDDKGATFQMPHGLEAFAPTKHIRKEDGKVVEPGETLMVKVIEFNKDDRRILVSHTRYVEDLMHRTEAILNAEKQETEHEVEINPIGQEIEMVFVQGGTFQMGGNTQSAAINPHPAVQKSADIQSFHANTFNRSSQYDEIQIALSNSGNLHFFCLYGDERQAHKSFFKSVMYDLKGQYVNEDTSKAKAVVSVDFVVDEGMGANSPERLKELLVRNLYMALGLGPREYQPFTRQNLSNLLPESERTRDLRKGDYLCVFAYFSHWYWDPVLTPEVVQWFVHTFCAPQLPPNSPTVLFFFSFDFNEDDNPGVRNEIFEFVNTGVKDIVVLPELTKLLKHDRSENIEQDNVGGGVSVTISDFNIGKYLVTQKLWQEIMGTNPSHFTGNDDCPVENASWDDVQDFLEKLNARFPGNNYRLPTEAEWEYAARGGNLSKDYTYAGSNDLGEVAWFSKNSDSKTHPIGIKKSNELGLHDMSGNVWEWCEDRYGDYPSTSQINPIGPTIGSDRVIRGGAWGGASEFCRVSFRHGSPPGYRGSNIGFRVASSVQQGDKLASQQSRTRPVMK